MNMRDLPISISSSISFLRVILEISLNMSFTSLVRLIPWYFESIISEFPSLISFSVHLSYIGKLLIFCVLILYSDILLKVFINFISFLMVMLGYFKYRNISHTNSDRWTFYFPISISFILLDKTLVTILNRIGDYKHPCLVPAFNENVL